MFFCKHLNPGYTNLQQSDLTQLEDWLIDIETTADLTDESRTKLAQVKLKGLTCTLITEALTSGKCWEEIKDFISKYEVQTLILQ